MITCLGEIDWSFDTYKAKANTHAQRQWQTNCSLWTRVKPQMPLVLSVACMRPSQCSCAEQHILLVQLQSPEGSSRPYEEVAAFSDADRTIHCLADDSAHSGLNMVQTTNPPSSSPSPSYKPFSSLRVVGTHPGTCLLHSGHCGY